MNDIKDPYLAATVVVLGAIGTVLLGLITFKLGQMSGDTKGFDRGLKHSGNYGKYNDLKNAFNGGFTEGYEQRRQDSISQEARIYASAMADELEWSDPAPNVTIHETRHYH